MIRCIVVLSLLAALALFCPAYAETIIPGGPVSGIWTLAGSPYLIQNNVSIDSVSTLIIDPGVQVLLYPSAAFTIKGRILAEGTESDTIVFTSQDIGNWARGFIILNLDSNALDTSRFSYCEFSKFKKGDYYSGALYIDGGAMNIQYSSKVIIQNCLFENNKTGNCIGADGANGAPGMPGEPGDTAYTGNGGAIYFYYSHIYMLNCTFEGNRTGDAIGGDGGDGASSVGSGTVYGQDGGNGGYANSGLGGAIYLENSNAVILNCILSGNCTGIANGGMGGDGGDALAFYMSEAYGGDGGDGGNGYSGEAGAICSKSSSPFFYKCLIYNDYPGNATGGSGGEGGTAAASYAIPGSDGGGGDGLAGQALAIYGINANDTYLNCTITNNDLIGYGFGGSSWALGLNSSYLASGQNMTFVNCIIWDNALHPSSLFTYQYSCLDLLFTGIGNISQNPLFIDPLTANYHLQSTSPCIDAGNPDPIYNDPDGTRNDMGAYYFDQTPPLVIEDLTITVEGNSIVLQWAPLAIANSYHIYRSNVPYFEITGMTPLSNTTTASYTDTNALSGETWFYKVTFEY